MDKNLKTLLAHNKGTLSGLHEKVGIDYNQPFKTYFIKGRYTINSVLKMVGSDDFDCSNSVIYIATEPRTSFSNYLHLVSIEDNKANTNFWCRGFNRWYTVRDYEDNRKNDNNYHVVICQKKEYLSEIKSEYSHADYRGRFKLVEKDNYLSTWSWSTVHYIEDIQLLNISNRGESITYYVHGHETEIDQVIDKSGYLVNVYRQDLQDRLAQHKEELAKTAYSKTNNNSALIDLKERIDKVKKTLIEEFQLANDAKSITTFSEKISGYWCGFKEIVVDYEELLEHERKKDLPSVSSFEVKYNSIVSSLNKLENWEER